MARAKQVKQEEIIKTPEPVQKQIKRGKRKPGQKKQQEPKDSPQSPIKRQKKTTNEEKVAVKVNQGNKYPQKFEILQLGTKELTFPNELQDQLILIIIQCGNSAQLKSIIKHLSSIYVNGIDLSIVHDQLAISEEEGTIFERVGKYSVTNHLISSYSTTMLKPDIITKINADEDQLYTEDQLDHFEIQQRFQREEI